MRDGSRRWSFQHLARIVSAGAGAALDVVLPPRCLGCGALVAGPASLCTGCWTRLSFIAEPRCRSCGHPLPHAMQGATGCGTCRRAPLPVDRARAALAYDDGSKALILPFKHAGRIEAAGLFAGWMVEAGADLLADADWLLPVPLHRWRLLHRGYNQAALLTTRIGRLAGRRTAPDLLLRQRATASQHGKGRADRAGNITAAAFGLAAGAGRQLAGTRVLLVDDVLTTGATLGACATVLRRAGVVRVDALTVARVVKGDPIPI